LYAVDPASEELLWYNSSLLEAKMTGRAAQTNLKYVITGDLHVQVRPSSPGVNFCFISVLEIKIFCPCPPMSNLLPYQQWDLE
jgi:hypothetical protein